MAVHINNSLFDRFGWKIRRQDGMKFQPEQIDFLWAAAEEIEAALPGLDFAWRYSGLLVEYTRGDFIRGQSYKTLGLYYPGANKIVVGPTVGVYQPSLCGLAHELGHALDWISAYPRHTLNRFLDRDEHGDKPAFSYGDLEHVLEANHAPLLQARASMSVVDSAEDWAVQYNTKTEAWARLFEQFVAYQLRKAGRQPISTMSWEHYAEEIGFWTDENFDNGLSDQVVSTACRMVERTRSFASLNESGA